MKKVRYFGTKVNLYPSLSILIGKDNVKMLEVIKEEAGETALFFDGCPTIEDLEEAIFHSYEIVTVVIIKDVERDLTPAKQRKVIAKLLRCLPKFQLIITTNSPYVLGTEIGRAHV